MIMLPHEDERYHELNAVHKNACCIKYEARAAITEDTALPSKTEKKRKYIRFLTLPREKGASAYRKSNQELNQDWNSTVSENIIAAGTWTPARNRMKKSVVNNATASTKRIRDLYKRNADRKNPEGSQTAPVDPALKLRLASERTRYPIAISEIDQ